MSDYDRDDAARACMSKRRYATAGHAGKVAALRGAAGLRVYPCPVCQGFHLTSATLGEVVERRGKREEQRRPLWERVCRPMPGYLPPTATDE